MIHVCSLLGDKQHLDLATSHKFPIILQQHGSLLHYLRRLKPTLSSDVGTMLDIVIQVCRGMAYLERHNYIHRDLVTLTD